MGKNMKLQDVLPAWLVTRKGEPVPYGDRVRPRKIGRWFRKCLGIYGDLSHGIYGDFFNDECSNEVIKDSLKDGKLFNLLWSSGEEYIFIAGEKNIRNSETRENLGAFVAAEENIWVSFQYLSAEKIMIPADPKKYIGYDARRAYVVYVPEDFYIDFTSGFMWHIKNSQQINRKFQPAVYYLTQAIALKKYVVEQCDSIIPRTPEGEFLMGAVENLLHQYLSLMWQSMLGIKEATEEKQVEIKKSLEARNARAERLGYHTATSDDEATVPDNGELGLIADPIYVLNCEEEKEAQHGEENDG